MEKIDYSDWANPTVYVKKKDDKIRIYNNSNSDPQVNDKVDFISLPRNLLKHLKTEDQSAVSRISFFAMQEDKLYRNTTNPQCVYWDESPGQNPHWSTKGCSVSKYVPGEKALCSCNHLTSFALLMVGKIMTTC
uniref:GAIN-B domain-containing protein n=1 Tax=Octopus bimaculoides TaxID=37653 RepID=A0A0L8HHD9_OCTBM